MTTSLTGRPVPRRSGRFLTTDPDSAMITFSFDESKLTGPDDTVDLQLDFVRNVDVVMGVGRDGQAIETVAVESINEDGVNGAAHVNSLNGRFAADGNASTMTMSGPNAFLAHLASNFTTFAVAADAQGPIGDQTLKFEAEEVDLVETGAGDDTLIVKRVTGAAQGDDISTDGGDDIVKITEYPTQTLGATGVQVSLGEGNDILQTPEEDMQRLAPGELNLNVTVDAGDGKNSIRLGDGNHAVTAGSGDDTVLAGDGDITVTAGDGNNDVLLGDGNHTVTSGSGNDAIEIGDGNSSLTTGDGDDRVQAGEGNHTIDLGNGDGVDDTVDNSAFVDDGDSTITGGDDVDVVSIGDGDYKVSTNGSNDTIEVRDIDDLNANDMLDGGEGDGDSLVLGDAAATSVRNAVGRSQFANVKGIEILDVESNNATIDLADVFVENSTTGLLDINLRGDGQVVNTVEEMTTANIAAVSIFDAAGDSLLTAANNDSTILVDADFAGFAEARLGFFDLFGRDDRDVLIVEDSANLTEDAFDNMSGLDEIRLETENNGPQNFTFEFDQAFFDDNSGRFGTKAMKIVVDDAVPSNSTLKIDLTDPSLLDANDLNVPPLGPNTALIIENNANLDDNEIEVSIIDPDTGRPTAVSVGDEDFPTWINVVTALDLTAGGDTDLNVTGGDDIVVADQISDLNPGDDIDALGQNRFSDGDELQLQFGVNLLADDGTGSDDAGRTGVTSANSVGFLSEIFGFDPSIFPLPPIGASLQGFEKISFEGGPVSFVDDVTANVIPTLSGGTTYGSARGNISDWGWVLFDTTEARGGDYIQTLDFNSTQTGNGDDYVELLDSQNTVSSAPDPQADQPDGSPLGQPLFKAPTRTHNTGEGDDRIILNNATAQLALANMTFLMGEGTRDEDILEIRPNDAFLPDDTAQVNGTQTLGNVTLNAGALNGSSGLNIIEYASSSAQPMNTTRITLNDNDLAAFDVDNGQPLQRLATVRPVDFNDVRDNRDNLIFDASAVTSGQGRVDVTGSAFADTITGTQNGDTLTGLGGDDALDGQGGDDVISGGAGNDEIIGGTGDDTITGGIGDDTITAGDGNDSVTGGDGNDDITGGAGVDTIDGGRGDDTIDGGAEADILTGGAGADSMNGGLGDDEIDSGSGNDQVYGGTGDDTIEAGTGADNVAGAEGDDEIDLGDDTAADQLFFVRETDGFDTVTNFNPADDTVLFADTPPPGFPGVGNLRTALDDNGNNTLDFVVNQNADFRSFGPNQDEALLIDADASGLTAAADPRPPGLRCAGGDQYLRLPGRNDDDALIVLQGQDPDGTGATIALFFREQSGPAFPGAQATAEPNEITELAVFENALLDENHFGLFL